MTALNRYRIAPGTEGGGEYRNRPGGRGRVRSGSQAIRVGLDVCVPDLPRDLAPLVMKAPDQVRGVIAAFSGETDHA